MAPWDEVTRNEEDSGSEATMGLELEAVRRESKNTLCIQVSSLASDVIM
jgi:hypothetical protein